MRQSIYVLLLVVYHCNICFSQSSIVCTFNLHFGIPTPIMTQNSLIEKKTTTAPSESVIQTGIPLLLASSYLLHYVTG